MGVNLASFPNSRINPTPATSDARQKTYVAPANTVLDPLVPVIATNANRTYLEVYNRSATDSFKFMNQKSGDPVPTKAQILADGFEVIAGAAYEIETPQNVYAVSTTANPVIFDTDEGSG